MALRRTLVPRRPTKGIGVQVRSNNHPSQEIFAASSFFWLNIIATDVHVYNGPIRILEAVSYELNTCIAHRVLAYIKLREVWVVYQYFIYN